MDSWKDNLLELLNNTDEVNVLLGFQLALNGEVENFEVFRDWFLGLFEYKRENTVYAILLENNFEACKGKIPHTLIYPILEKVKHDLRYVRRFYPIEAYYRKKIETVWHFFKIQCPKKNLSHYLNRKK